jgi:hypothetical protein
MGYGTAISQEIEKDGTDGAKENLAFKAANGISCFPLF